MCIFLDEMMNLRVKIEGVNEMIQGEGNELHHEKHYHEDHQGRRGKKKRHPYQHSLQSHQDESHKEDTSHSIRESLLSSDRAHLFMIYDEIIQISTYLRMKLSCKKE